MFVVMIRQERGVYRGGYDYSNFASRNPEFPIPNLAVLEPS